MKKISRPVLPLFVPILLSFCCKKSPNTQNNSRPIVQLAAEMISANPFTFKFVVTASDVEGDPLTYSWNFGEGTVKKGSGTETFSYPDDRVYKVTVTVSDGQSPSVEATETISTVLRSVSVDLNQTYQTMEGFGGFGAMDNYWTAGPFTSPAFVNTLIDDLGVSILRDNIPSNFEIVNDNADPRVTDLSKFNLDNNSPGIDGKLADHIPYLKNMHAAGLEKLIVSIWSAPPWMKTNNRVDNGTTQNSAPAYNENPTPADNQLRKDMYEEFAEMCVAYVKVMKRETGIDIYALSIQNEPRFSQFYASCVYNGAALRDLLKVVGKRFRAEGLNTKLFLPEDIGWLEGVAGMVKPSLEDPESRDYADIVAVHGYDLDGVTANSPDAQSWKTMYSWGASYNKPLWMTETSGYKNDWAGAIRLAKAMYTAIRQGNVSAWLYWTISTGTLDEFSLMSSSGLKSKRYYVSRNFYRFIRPGAQRVSADAPADSHIYPLAFRHILQQATTIIIINESERPEAITILGGGLPSRFNQFTTTALQDCIDTGPIETNSRIILPPNSVTTLYSKN
jgi:O-glycosyl hydrolase